MEDGDLEGTKDRTHQRSSNGDGGSDSGSPEVQIALAHEARINYLTEHMRDPQEGLRQPAGAAPSLVSQRVRAAEVPPGNRTGKGYLAAHRQARAAEVSSGGSRVAECAIFAIAEFKTGNRSTGLRAATFFAFDIRIPKSARPQCPRIPAGQRKGPYPCRSNQASCRDPSSAVIAPSSSKPENSPSRLTGPWSSRYEGDGRPGRRRRGERRSPAATSSRSRCEYRERTYAAGKFPGGFIKRETRPSTKETLTSRLIDRPIRPLFPVGYVNEVQIHCDRPVSAQTGRTTPTCSPSSAPAPRCTSRTSRSSSPTGPCASAASTANWSSCRPHTQMEESDLDLIVAGTRTRPSA